MRGSQAVRASWGQILTRQIGAPTIVSSTRWPQLDGLLDALAGTDEISRKDLGVENPQLGIRPVVVANIEAQSQCHDCTAHGNWLHSHLSGSTTSGRQTKAAEIATNTIVTLCSIKEEYVSSRERTAISPAAKQQTIGWQANSSFASDTAVVLGGFAGR